MKKKVALPPEFDKVRELAQRAILPIKPADTESKAEKRFLFTAKRTVAGSELPPYYLVYFLLVNLLGFEDLGRFEKLAWSVPIDFNGTAYLIEHRKFGIGVFAGDAESEEQNATGIVNLIKKGVKVAQPFFRWMADNAVRDSKFNVINNSTRLFARYEYMRNLYEAALTEAQERKQEKREELITDQFLMELLQHPYLRYDPRGWLAMAAIDAFFGWTEHIFIHLAILQGKITSGAEIASLAGEEWNVKFKHALDITNREMKTHFDELMIIRRQLRNCMAHGAFGKGGEAFHFHSPAGAVPVAFDYTSRKPKFSLSPELAFDDAKAIGAIEGFIKSLWSGPREAARIYIQDSELPLILPMAHDGTYKKAMSSLDDMNSSVVDLTHQFENATNMDW